MINLDEIKNITFDIKSYIKYRFIRMTNWEDVFENLMQELAYSFSKWSGNTYVGKENDEELKMVYQDFFENIYLLIDSLEKNKHKIMNIEAKFINSIKYNGKVYRYLGYGDSTDKKRKQYIKPVYNDVYVSWSKNEENQYLESKLYGKITKLYCEIPNEKYGLDLEKFQDFINSSFACEFYISKGTEREVIFPTIEEYIYEIKYV